ncbi:MAG: prolyl oligopeptidase family serine peptidase [Candidatus Saccharibacteria bacterium]|nr:prolyl oligopeptidase family serine peptidase [Rhodoferax sp.]
MSTATARPIICMRVATSSGMQYLNRVIFPDEGHGSSKQKNNMETNRKIVEFLDKHLKAM